MMLMNGTETVIKEALPNHLTYMILLIVAPPWELNHQTESLLKSKSIQKSWTFNNAAPLAYAR